MQSGQDRGIFEGDGHKEEVTGVGVDCLNKILVSGSKDGAVIMWDFFRRVLMRKVDIGSAIEKMTYNRVNDLVAISTFIFEVQVMSAKSSRLEKVRTFPKAAKDAITDICFS
mmetsp:Transcript_18310/g.13305  ORF Transcript_18310/g.13305 Transcript_18310/m.13305 type:complete len:112 (-) Transcript_18310:906-1241(-)|eukprot:CAMPEP_0202980052 /NCGR_PEP_ID=MMETSP1396-20130829/86044_1 /ASSEMBLY_ACC=CAM_ASM_000872 /TAXON_ID= /ORGANISM="Pseudokeronopsis sp., Strain Brazil" /LENGTH=111 /DNA_ID=CAMNT_0049719775 /DNA_START=124 /DNA_END=459 /DNA_ORIENTATION=+